MTAFRLKIIEAILACIFTAVGLLWSYLVVSDRFVWLLEYAGVSAFGVLFVAVMEYLKERKSCRRNIYFPEAVLWRPDWLNFYIVIASSVLMLNVFAWVGMGGWSNGMLFWMAILSGGSLGKLAAMYRFGAAPATDTE